jgi:dephospho-CoA kinase
MENMKDESPSLKEFSESSAQRRSRIIGLTGGVGMGKTTVSNYLATTYQLPVLDADLYARQAVEPGSAVLGKLVERYGPSIVLRDGMLDRRRLGDIVFQSPPERLWLEQQIHPYVRDRFEAELPALTDRGQTTIVLVIPLLFEARMDDLVDEIWVVYCPHEQQTKRLRERDHLTIEQINARINSQMAIEEKLKRADTVLNNSSTVDALLQQVDTAFNSPIRTFHPASSS